MKIPDKEYQDAFRTFEQDPDDAQNRRNLLAWSKRLPQHRTEIFEALEINGQVYDSFKAIGLRLNEVSEPGQYPLMSYEMLSGAIMWTDEVIEGNPQYRQLQPLNTAEIGCMRYVFNYRTHLTLDEPPLKYEPYWLEAKRCFPNWVGFQKSRSTLTQRFRDCYEEHHPSHPKIVEAHCPQCESQLRSNKAKQCLACGATWHSGLVIDEVYDWSDPKISELNIRLASKKSKHSKTLEREGFRALWKLSKWDFTDESELEQTESRSSTDNSFSLPRRIGRALLILFLAYLATGALYSAWDTAIRLFNF